MALPSRLASVAPSTVAVATLAPIPNPRPTPAPLAWAPARLTLMMPSTFSVLEGVRSFARASTMILPPALSVDPAALEALTVADAFAVATAPETPTNSPPLPEIACAAAP